MICRCWHLSIHDERMLFSVSCISVEWFPPVWFFSLLFECHGFCLHAWWIMHSCIGLQLHANFFSEQRSNYRAVFKKWYNWMLLFLRWQNNRHSFSASAFLQMRNSNFSSHKKQTNKMAYHTESKSCFSQWQCYRNVDLLLLFHISINNLGICQSDSDSTIDICWFIIIVMY